MMADACRSPSSTNVGAKNSVGKKITAQAVWIHDHKTLLSERTDEAAVNVAKEKRIGVWQNVMKTIWEDEVSAEEKMRYQAIADERNANGLPDELRRQYVWHCSIKGLK